MPKTEVQIELLHTAVCRLANHWLYDYIPIHFAHLMHCLCHLGSLCEAFVMVTTLQRGFCGPCGSKPHPIRKEWSHFLCVLSTWENAESYAKLSRWGILANPDLMRNAWGGFEKKKKKVWLDFIQFHLNKITSKRYECLTLSVSPYISSKHINKPKWQDFNF